MKGVHFPPGFTPEIVARVLARVNAFERTMAIHDSRLTQGWDPKLLESFELVSDPSDLPPLDLRSLERTAHDVQDGEALCNACQGIDLRTLRGETTSELEYLLGEVEDIVQNDSCALCRMVKQSLLLSWTALPLFAKDGSRIRCHLFIPGSTHRRWAREAVVMAIVPENGQPAGTVCFNGRPTLAVMNANRSIPPIVAKNKPIELEWLPQTVSERCNMRYLAEQYAHCMLHHGATCAWFKLLQRQDPAVTAQEMVQAMSYAKNLRVIDVAKLRLVQAPRESSFVVLSYVWGRQPFLRLTMDNKAALEQEGALNKGVLPTTVQDAIDVTRILGEKYLWVDALCIVQDDLRDKEVQIRQMSLIYSSAALTIVAAGGTNAYAGLPGVRSGTRALTSTVESVKGLQLMATCPTISNVLASSCWNTRGWTFQELALSKRVLLFTPQQAYYICQSDVCSEDTVPSVPSKMKSSPHEPPSVYGLSIEKGLWSCYIDMVTKFMTRQFTYDYDVLNALEGIFGCLRAAQDEFFIAGLPETILDAALLWLPVGSLSRRQGSLLDGKFPSWSWAGWVGEIEYGIMPDQIHTEVTEWSIKTASDTYNLYVDSNYLGLDDGINISTRFRGLRDGRLPCPTFELTCPEWKPSPWRKEPPVRVPKDRSSTHKFYDAASEPIIQHGLLCFKAESASFVIYPNHPVYRPALPYANNGSRKLLSLCTPDENNELAWVGYIVVDGKAAEDLTVPFMAECIALSSTASGISGGALKGSSFDEKNFATPPGKDPAPYLYNVMWIDWCPDGESVRRGVGQIHKDGWELANALERSFSLA